MGFGMGIRDRLVILSLEGGETNDGVAGRERVEEQIAAFVKQKSDAAGTSVGG